MQITERTVGRAMCLLLLPALAGCSISTALSGNEILEELDQIVRIEGSGRDRRIVYTERAKVSAWYMHNAVLAPIRTPLAILLGRRNEVALENPGAHVRELLRELPDETAGYLNSCAAATSRLGWLAELDRNLETRVLAIDGLSRVSQQLQLTPFAGSFTDLATPLASETLALARADLRVGEPATRRAGGNLESYRLALAQITSHPLGEWVDRLWLVERLGSLYAQEQDAQARPWVESALRSSIEHCIRGILLRTIRGRDRHLVEVRLCAMEQIRRMGGPRTVPLMLATMAATTERQGVSSLPFDSDSLVRLRLIHYCGQLSGDLGNAVVHLPGRQDWQATSPNEFLARTVLQERDYYSKLRTPAIVALSWALGRKHIDPDPAWVSAWIEQQRS